MNISSVKIDTFNSIYFFIEKLTYSLQMLNVSFKFIRYDELKEIKAISIL